MTSTPQLLTTSDLLGCTIRELNERWPATLGVLAPLGIDLCCGGGHMLGVALELHHIDPEPVVAAIVDAIGQVER